MARPKYKYPEAKGLSKVEKDKIYTTAYRRRNPDRNLHRSAKARAKNKNIPFDLDYTDIVIPDKCPILNITLVSGVDTGAGGNENSPSLDRIDNTKGYIKGNIQVISNKANSMKFTATPEELLLFADWIYRTYK